MAARRINAVLVEIRKNGFSTSPSFSIGGIGADVKRFAKREGITLGSDDIYISRKFLTHAMRASKGRRRVAQKDIIDFPMRKRYMKRYYDGKVFVFTDYRTKFIIRPNYEIKLPNGEKRVANLITAGKVTNREEFKLKKYRKI